MIVMLHPQANPFSRLIEAIKLRSFQKLFPDRFPEPLDFAQGLRMMRLTPQMMHPILAQLLLKARCATPRRVLPSVVRQHFFRHAVLADRRAIDFQHVLRRLAAKQTQPHDVTGMIVDKPDQIRILAMQSPCEDIGLPHLIGCRSLKEARLGWITAGLAPLRFHQLLPMQQPPYRFRTDR